MTQIRVLVAGAAGKMGREVVRAITSAQGINVIAAVDVAHVGEDAGVLAGVGAIGVAVEPVLDAAITARRPDVLCDFTQPAVVMENLRVAVPRKVACVVGTTGLTAKHLEELRALTAASGSPVFIAPNFALGAVLMMRFAQQSARYFDYAEVLEYHHEKKLDAPSGTALRTAEMIREAAAGRLVADTQRGQGEESRGVATGNIRVHAVRMPGFVASQDVIFGGPGETLTLRHSTINRECFMPGVVLAIRKVRELTGVVVGLDALL